MSKRSYQSAAVWGTVIVSVILVILFLCVVLSGMRASTSNNSLPLTQAAAASGQPYSRVLNFPTEQVNTPVIQFAVNAMSNSKPYMLTEGNVKFFELYFPATYSDQETGMLIQIVRDTIKYFMVRTTLQVGGTVLRIEPPSDHVVVFVDYNQSLPEELRQYPDMTIYAADDKTTSITVIARGSETFGDEDFVEVWSEARSIMRNLCLGFARHTPGEITRTCDEFAASAAIAYVGVDKETARNALESPSEGSGRNPIDFIEEIFDDFVPVPESTPTPTVD